MSLYEFEQRMGFREKNDVFQYEEVTEKFRKQFFVIISHCVNEQIKENDEYWGFIEKKLMVEFAEVNFYGDIYGSSILKYLIERSDSEALYIIEEMLITLEKVGKYFKDKSKGEFVEAIAQCFLQVNKKFLENGLGYEYQSNQLIRIDNKFIHKEVITNAITLLHEEEFESASNEYLKAFDEYKNGERENALVFARRAFESTMKIICERLGYRYKQKSQAYELIGILKNNNFIPKELKYHFEHFSEAMQSGLPTVSNKESHGKGILIENVTDKIVQYALNLCATNIVFLVGTYKEHIANR